MKFSRKEIIDLCKAWVVISFAFAVVFKNTSDVFINIILFSLLTVGSGFLLHELAHKWLAQSYGYWAEFRSDDKMLLLALLMSFFGFVFAAPGGVLMPRMGLKKEGIIALAGPMSNVFLALTFLTGNFLYSSQFFFYGMYINSFLAIFNLIPFPGFDGSKVIIWNKIVWVISLFIAGLTFYLPLALS